jgi:hypothetical protein
MKKRLLSARIPLAIFSLIFSMVGSSYAAQIISVNVMAGSGRNVMSGSDAAGAPGVRTNNWNELSSTDSSLAAGAVKGSSGRKDALYATRKAAEASWIRVMPDSLIAKRGADPPLLAA